MSATQNVNQDYRAAGNVADDGITAYVCDIEERTNAVKQQFRGVGTTGPPSWIRPIRITILNRSINSPCHSSRSRSGQSTLNLYRTAASNNEAAKHSI